MDETSPRGSHVVLIVEDDSLQRMLAVGVVEDAGFIALEASNADEAIVLLESRTDIALLFTDINMPGSIDGLELAHAVGHRWPPIKILVVSGQDLPHQPELPSDSCFVPKPYRTAAIVAELHSLIGSPGTSVRSGCSTDVMSCFAHISCRRRPRTIELASPALLLF